MKNITQYPSECKSMKNAWVAAMVFRGLLLHLYSKMVRKISNILLLLDQCSVHNHKGLALTYVPLMYLPLHTSSHYAMGYSVI
jgi:hypothetical protein